MKSKRIVITGMGAVSCLGHGVPALWDGLVAGRCGLASLKRLDASRHRIQHGGEVPPLPEQAEHGDYDLAVRYMLGAAEEALEQAGLSLESRRSVALVLGSNFGAMASTEDFLCVEPLSGGTRESLPFMDGPTQAVAKQLGLGGVCSTLSLSCASGNAAIGHAADLIRSGHAQAVLAGGYDAISELVWAGLGALRAMSSKALLPFDRRRDGTIFSEGAGALLLEGEQYAAARGARPLAEFLACATSSNAFHMTHPDPHGQGMARAMRDAVRASGIAPDQVDQINAHATGTQPNDKLETEAIKSVFGAHAKRIPVNGIKSMLGHAMGAASALEAIATVMTIREGMVPPTIGLEEPDPECDLDYVPLKARQSDVHIALNNSAGFGGCNAAVVLRRWEG